MCGCVNSEKRLSWEDFGRGEICPCLLFLSTMSVGMDWIKNLPGQRSSRGRSRLLCWQGRAGMERVSHQGHAKAAAGDQTQRNTLALPV